MRNTATLTDTWATTQSLEALFQQGSGLQQQGRLPEAEAVYQSILRSAPRHFGALYHLGVMRLVARQHKDAERLLHLAISRQPYRAELHNNYGIALRGLGRHADAIRSYETAVALDPNFAAAYNNLGNALLASGRTDAAQTAFERALALKPNDPGSLTNLGLVLAATGQHEAALDSYRRALAIDPDHVNAYFNLGNALAALDRPEDAVTCYEAALALRADYPEALCNLGSALNKLGRHDAAIARHQQATSLRPDYADAHANLGNALRALGRYDEAIEAYDEALTHQPGHANAEWNASLALLSTGAFERGWRLYEARWRIGMKGVTARACREPLWLGERDVAGRTLLLHAEQGLGDTIQFARYVPLLVARGARVVLEAQEALLPLLAGLPGIASVHAPGARLPAFDLHCPLLSLPLAFGTTLDTVPATVPYLRAPAEAAARWRADLPPADRPRVGFVWAGRAGHANDRNRSLPLESILPLLNNPEITPVILQKEVRDGDEALLAEISQAIDVRERLSSFVETAAAISQLDLVVTVDTSVAHLAGALGKPVWILLPFAPDFRWLLDRSDSPWYPTARLFRQPNRGDWDSVIATVNRSLATFRPR